MKAPGGMDAFGVQGSNTDNTPNAMTRTSNKMELPDLTDYNLSDDLLFSIMMQQKEFCKKILEIILDKNFVDVEYNNIQQVLLNAPGYRSIRLDSFITDTQGKRYNVEMQKLNIDNMPKRSRFYQGLLDTSNLLQGKSVKYKDMTDVYIIFITDFDIFGYGLYKYVFTNQCEDIKGHHLGDGATRIFLNLKGKNNTNVTQGVEDLLHFIKDSRQNFISQDTKVQELVNLTANLKNNKKVREQVMQTSGFIFEAEERAMERGMKKGMEKGMEKGIISALAMLEDLGFPKDTAIQHLKKSFNLTEEEALEYYNKYSEQKKP